MNFNTQNEKIRAIIEKTLVVDIDIGSEIHYVKKSKELDDNIYA